MEILLRRNLILPGGVFGSFEVPAFEKLVTAEDDWRENARGVSCIPAGVYPLRRTIWNKYKIEVFQICDVPGRDLIYIHSGNTEEDSAGCPLLGLRMGRFWVPDEDDPKHKKVWKDGVVSSRIAFHRFMTRMTDVDEATIRVEWADGLPGGDNGI